MSRRRIYRRINDSGTGFAVYRDSVWGEFITEFVVRGQRQEGASYHTDTREDARDTGEAWLSDHEAQPAELRFE